MSALYPLKFKPVFKETLWGGSKLRTHLGKDLGALSTCGESWEVSGMESDASIVTNGELAGWSLPSVLREYRGALAGEAVAARFGTHFPLLVKFIDARDDLSVQAHPDNALARARHGRMGKTEMWYVVQADPGATLVAGFNRDVSPEIYLDNLGSGTLDTILQRESVAAGDVFFLPAGRVHSIGKGILIAEIQQASDLTYRLHDFGRLDAAGRARTLHTGEALAALDYRHHPEARSRYDLRPNQAVTVVSCRYFTTRVLDFDRTMTRDYAFDSFVIQVCVKGAYTLNYGDAALEVEMGDCVLVPASIKGVTLETGTGARILESFIV